MSRSRRKRPPAISRRRRRPRRISTTPSAARWKSIDDVTALATATPGDALSLLTADAVRSRAGMMLDAALRDGLAHFRIDLDRMTDVADAVLATIDKAYPSLNIPFHARWRHFVIDGADRWADIADRVS